MDWIKREIAILENTTDRLRRIRTSGVGTMIVTQLNYYDAARSFLVHCHSKLHAANLAEGVSGGGR